MTRKQVIAKTSRLKPESIYSIDILLYIKEIDTFIKIVDGTGDNLLQEDREEGYNDYLYCTLLINNEEGYEEVEAVDDLEAPMIYFCNDKEECKEKFVDYYHKQHLVVADVLEEAFGKDNVPEFMILKY